MLATRQSLALFLVLLAFPPGLRAAEPAPADSALGKVPADVETFGTMLRMGEMVEIIGKSRAWDQIWSEPAVQGFWQMARAKYDQPGGDFAPLKEFLSKPENREIPALLADAVSNEFFLYTGAGTGDSVALFQELIGGARYGRIFQRIAGQKPEDENRARVRIILGSLSEKPERIDIPDIVMGFKVNDSAKVAAQIKRLQPVLTDALAQTPLKGRLTMAKVAGDDFLTLNLDGSLVPWDEIPIAMYEDKPGEFAPLFKALKAKKIAIALGVRQGYLILSLGIATEHLAKFGGPGPKLASLPEMKPLAKFQGKPFTSISFTSVKLLEKIATTTEDISGLAELLKQGLSTLELPEDLEKAIEKDIDLLGRSLGHEVPKPGADLSFSFRTGRGWEGYRYDYSPSVAVSQKPLSMLNHVGGDPIAAAVWRSGTTVNDYQNLVKWVSRFGGHVEKIIKVKEPNADTGLKIYRDKVLPLIQQFSQITEKQWIPALADGQEAFVLDAKLKSAQWVQAMPPTEKPIPILEPAMILGVSDRKLFEDSLDSYFQMVNKVIATVRELSPEGSVPEFQLPKPSVSRENGRTFAFYPIPPFAGVDRQLQPTGGLNDEVAVLALSLDHVNRLLTRQPLKTRMTPLENTSRPLESATYFNWAGLMDAVNEWVAAAAPFADPNENNEGFRLAKKAINLLKVFQQFGSATYREGGVTITHSELVLADVK